MKHHCHALGCKEPCHPRMLMCNACWSLVPRGLQLEVYRTVKLRDMSGCDATWAPWWRASHKAIHAVAVALGHGNERLDRWLENEMSIADKLETD